MFRRRCYGIRLVGSGGGGCLLYGYRARPGHLELLTLPRARLTRVIVLSFWSHRRRRGSAVEVLQIKVLAANGTITAYVM